jgi:hypothetical protein
MIKRNLKENLQENDVENMPHHEKMEIYLDVDLYNKYKSFITGNDILNISESDWAMIIKFNPQMFRVFQNTWYATPSKIRKFLNIYPILKLYI